jgi:hypothetical protein
MLDISLDGLFSDDQYLPEYLVMPQDVNGESKREDDIEAGLIEITIQI